MAVSSHFQSVEPTPYGLAVIVVNIQLFPKETKRTKKKK
jgi:hypothetical protein